VGQENPLSSEFIAKVEEANKKLERVKSEIAKVIVGQNELIDRLLIALLCDGHLLLEGVPGIAKTLAVNSFAKVLQLDFKRIQFTPDLLPSDLIGTSIFNPKEASFSVEKGPVFTNVVLADEINRAPPKVQSALLEVMQEKQVTISGQTFKTKSPFIVLGTQNPIEHEGTYPLPEAQTDRFMMKVLVDYPTMDEEKEIVKRVGSASKPTIDAILGDSDILAMRDLVRGVFLDEKILNYIVEIVFETREPQDLLEYGASPRASINLALCSKAHALMQGRAYVTPFDVKAVGCDVLRHRLILSYEAQAQEISPDDVINSIFDQVVVP
jgi:MoxR-like ATPase